MKNIVAEKMKRTASLKGRVSEYIGELSDYDFLEIAKTMELDGLSEFYSMDELDEILNGREPFEILKIGRDLDLSSDYFKFDGYGYLVGYSTSEVASEIRGDYEDYVIEELVNGLVPGSVFENLPDELKEILETDWEDEEGESEIE